jgi:hypothetical protein
MAFEYAKSALAESIIPVKDRPLDATYAGTYAVGDVVKLDGNGKVVKAEATDTTVLGVLEGTNYEGMAVDKVITRTTAKVRESGQAIYRAPYTGGTLSDAIVGKKYKINANQQVVLANAGAAGSIYNVVGYDADRGFVYVQITSLING